MQNKAIVLVGPTGSHKTQLATVIARKFNGAIINADAFQVYQEIKIGTNKTDANQLKPVPIYNNDCISIFAEWSIKHFQTYTQQLLLDLLNKKQLPIIVGGSNLYVDALIYQYDLNFAKRNEQFTELSNEELFAKLSVLDPLRAQKITSNNRSRLIRALQLLMGGHQLTKRSQSSLQYLVIVCDYHSRSELYEQINHNVEKMFKQGWVDEIKHLLEQYPYEQLCNLNAFKAIGYREILQALHEGIEPDVAKIAQKTRNYAKRQQTWNKHHYPDAIYFWQDNRDDILEQVKQFLHGN